MAPPRRILRQQLEILMNFLEDNTDVSRGIPPGATVTHQFTKQKWSKLAKQLNTVQGGALKTPDAWKKYWFEWRHKCRKKAADRRFQAPEGGAKLSRFIPLNDLELRVIELTSNGLVNPLVPSSEQSENCLAEDSDSQPLENIKTGLPTVVKKVKKSDTSSSRTVIDDDNRTVSPPPRWAVDMEERRIAAEERMAEALESIAAVMRSQEERRAILEERIGDAVTAIAGTVQDLNSGIQDAIQHLQQMSPMPSHRPIKTVFL